MGFIRRAVAFILFVSGIISLIFSAPAPALAADAVPTAAIRVRIHDYANVNAAPLARAQHLVSRMYATIGVRTDWLDASRPLDDRTAASPCGPTDLTIIVLTPEMANRRGVPGAVVGYAAVTPGEAGRVAFVIYDRIRDIARRADADVVQVMGTVMAHELGHLLLPSGSHSGGGLMRGHWATTDFRRRDLQFSITQAEEIRQTIEAGALPIARDSSRQPTHADTSVGLLGAMVD
jgi:hypothetical protein